MFIYAKILIKIPNMLCALLGNAMEKIRMKLYRFWWIDNYFPNIGNCFPRELASFGIRINLLYEVSANVPKEFKTLMLIYFLSISTQMFLSKSILTGISLLLPAIWNSREKLTQKSISNSPPFISSHVPIIKKRNLLSLGETVVPDCYILNSHSWDCTGKRSLYLTFLLDRMTPKHPLNGLDE